MTQISRWGNSLAVRIPKGVAEEMGLQEGDDVAVEYSRRGRELVISKTALPLTPEQQARVLDDLETLRRRLQIDVAFDRDEANETDRFDRHGR